MSDKIHLFELAGLGKAPYRVLSLETSRDRESIQRERAGNGQTYTTNYCTTCDYCGTAISNAYQILSADEQHFKVGCDCLAKVGDKGLLDHAKFIAKKKKADEDHERWVLAHRQREAEERAANGGKTLKEIEIERAEQAKRDHVAKMMEVNGWILERISEADWRGVGELTRNPLKDMSDRYIDAIRRIWCGKVGPSRSKAYKLAQAEFDARLNG